MVDVEGLRVGDFDFVLCDSSVPIAVGARDEEGFIVLVANGRLRIDGRLVDGAFVLALDGDVVGTLPQDFPVVFEVEQTWLRSGCAVLCSAVQWRRMDESFKRRQSKRS